MGLSLKVDFKLTVNGKNVLRKYVKSITFKDEIDNKSDEITVVTIREFPRPNFGDEITLELGYLMEGLVFVGTFFVQSSTITNQQLSFRGTGVNFSSEAKKKKNRAWENTDISGVVNKIAGEHGWSSKCDKSHNFKYLAQSHESDLHLLQRLAKDLDCTFTVKNKTLLFLDKNKSRLKYTCDLSQAISSSIELTNKSEYKSAKISYRDDKKAKDVSVSVGTEKPTLEIKRKFEDESSARAYAESKMRRVSRGTVRGRIKIVGSTKPKAGGDIEVINSKYDDGIYKIKTVTHNLSSSGWTTDIEFEN